MVFRRQQKEESESCLDDLEIIKQARYDPAYFGLLYERFFTRIYNYCLRRLDQPEEAEDVTSQIFVQAFSNLAGFKGGSVAAWLFRIAHNTVLNQLRARRPQLSLELAVKSNSGWPGLLVNSGDSLLEGIVKDEENNQLAVFIAALPLEQRELLALSVAGGLTAREVGEVLGKSEGAVWKSMQRIVQKLRASYNRYAGMED